MAEKRAMPSFEKSPPELVERFGATIARHPEASVRKMFGYPAAFVNGNMATGLFGPSWMARLGDGDAAELLKRDGAAPFAPMPGRPMRGYYLIPPRIVADDAALEHWVTRSLAFTATLPAKVGSAN